MRRSLLFNIVFTSLLLGAPALATEPARRVLRLQYSEDARAASCPGEAALREQIQARAGYDPFREDAPEELDVAIVPRGADLVVTIRYRDAGGAISSERGFGVPNGEGACKVLTSNVALSIAFTLTPFGVGERNPAATAPPLDVAPAPTPAGRPTPARPQPAIAPETTRPATKIGAGGLARLEMTGEVLGGFACVLQPRRWGNMTLGLETRNLFAILPPDARAGGEGAGQDPSNPAGSPEGQTMYARALLAGAVALCLHPRDPFVGCGLVEIGTLLLSGQPGTVDTAVLAMALGARGGVEHALTDSLTLYAHAELLTAVRFHDAHVIDALRAPRLSASLGVGLLAGF
ncbi:hypothetical protein WMF18_14810 [Sorangium sp. So ce315]|uniref:hypothetical protein n=1 Tax=Sorangium sp. So ce315 TaxID=3133299 RepID=UPI003F5D6943